jgi:hypothetical protein
MLISFRGTKVIAMIGCEQAQLEIAAIALYQKQVFTPNGHTRKRPFAIFQIAVKVEVKNIDQDKRHSTIRDHRPLYVSEREGCLLI